MKSLFVFLSLSLIALSVSATDQRITAIEAHLDTLKDFRAKMVQTTLTGPQRGSIEGRFFLSKSNGMRIEYDAPYNVLIVATKRLLHYYDATANQISREDVDKTPASALLQPNVKIEQQFDVKNISEANGVINLSVVLKKAPSMGLYTFKFSKAPMAFLGWQVVDTQGTRIDVTFSNAQNTPFSSAEKDRLFVFRNPRIYGKKEIERFPKWY